MSLPTAGAAMGTPAAISEDNLPLPRVGPHFQQAADTQPAQTGHPQTFRRGIAAGSLPTVHHDAAAPGREVTGTEAGHRKGARRTGRRASAAAQASFPQSQAVARIHPKGPGRTNVLASRASGVPGPHSQTGIHPQAQRSAVLQTIETDPLGIRLRSSKGQGMRFQHSHDCPTACRNRAKSIIFQESRNCLSAFCRRPGEGYRPVT